MLLPCPLTLLKLKLKPNHPYMCHRLKSNRMAWDCNHSHSVRAKKWTLKKSKFAKRASLSNKMPKDSSHQSSNPSLHPLYSTLTITHLMAMVSA